MDVQEYFKDKKITVMGLGLLGRGVGDTAFLAACGAELLVTDLKGEEELKESLDALKEYSNIKYVLGEHRLEDFRNKDMILMAAGIPFDSEYIEEARKGDVPVEMSAALFARVSGVPIIGVTGTRGKSTITHMIHHTLSVATGEKVLLGGNVRGVSNLQLFNEMSEGSLCVMELDSWQLQGFGGSEISPQIAVFSNFMEDHMNYYNGDMDRYFADKANIFLYQEEGGTFVTTPDVWKQSQDFAKGKNITLGQEVVLADESILPEDCLLSMPGAHNRLNAALAYEALKATSLPEDLIMEGLASFPGVPGRLEYLGDVDGVKIYNDNNATTPAATMRGIEAVEDGKNVILIVGGSDKGIDATELAGVIKENVKHVVLYSGTGTEVVKELLDDAISSEEHEILDDCVAAAFKCAESGDVILFSPAFASFGKYFKNEYDRNDQFLSAIESIKKERAL